MAENLYLRQKSYLASGKKKTKKNERTAAPATAVRFVVAHKAEIDQQPDLHSTPQLLGHLPFFLHLKQGN